MPHVAELVDLWVNMILFALLFISSSFALVFLCSASIFSIWRRFLYVYRFKWQRVCLNIQQWYDCAVLWWWTKCNGWQKNANALLRSYTYTSTCIHRQVQFMCTRELLFKFKVKKGVRWKQHLETIISQSIWCEQTESSCQIPFFADKMYSCII